MHVCYICGDTAAYKLRNPVRWCCTKPATLCPDYVTYRKNRMNTPDSVTGLTPIDKMKLARSRINPETGLTVNQLAGKKAKETLDKVGPDGLSIRQKAVAKTQLVGEDGLTIRQKASYKTNELLRNRIDSETGLSAFTLRNINAAKSRKMRWATDPEAREIWIEKRNKYLDSFNHKEGMTNREILRKRSSERARTIDPITGEFYWQKLRKAGREKGLGAGYSKEACKIFNQLEQVFPELEFKYGKKGELTLETAEGRTFFYDCYIPSLGIVIEYHGDTWHPRRDKLTEREWDKWRQSVTKKTADEVYKDDLEKLLLVKSKYKHYLEIWTSTQLIDFFSVVEYIKEVLKNAR